MPTNHRIEFKIKSGTTSRIAVGDTTHTNASGYLEWIYAWYTDKLYYRNSSNAELNKNTGVSSLSSSYTYSLEYEGTTLKLYRDGTLLTSTTTYDPLTLTRLLRLHNDWKSNVSYIKVIPV